MQEKNTRKIIKTITKEQNKSLYAQSNIMYHTVNNVSLTALIYVGHDCQVQGDFASYFADFWSEIIRSLVLISSPVFGQKIDET